MSRGDFFPQAGGEIFPDSQPRRGAPETAQNAQGSGFRVITLPLDTALVNHEIKVKGNQFWIVDTTDLDVKANVQFNDLGGQGAPVAKGFALKGIPFNRIYVNADAQAAKTITILTTFIPNAPIEFVNPTNSANEVKVLKGTSIITSFPGQLTGANATIAANINRLGLVLKSWDANDDDIIVGSQSTFAALSADGAILGPGDSITLTEAAAAEIFWTSKSGTQFLSVFEEIK